MLEAPNGRSCLHTHDPCSVAFSRLMSSLRLAELAATMFK